MAIDPDELARLEEERRFLLRSIDDLDREHAAGDVDPADYQSLRDGYVARAAAVLRTIEHGRSALPPKRKMRPAVIGAWVAGTLVVGAVGGWAVARYSGQREDGQTMTGGLPADEVAVALTEARALMARGDYSGAFERFQRVSEIDPDNAEARTYTAWILVLNSASTTDTELRTASLDAALVAFAGVVSDEPGYADAHCLYAVTAGRFLDEPDVELARTQGELCLASNPPADIEGLVQSFLDGLDDGLDDGLEDPPATSAP